MSIIIQPTSVESAENVGTPTLYIQVKSEFNIQLETDLQSIFYNIEEFAQVISYTFKNGTQQTLNVIFDNETEAVDMATGAPVITQDPQFHCATNDFTITAGEGDSCLIGNKVYYVKEVSPDGVGVTVVMLRRS